MAATLTGEHYVRSTNQWSDPPTQIWLYNHDAEANAEMVLDALLSKDISQNASNGIEEMIRVGLLAP